MRKIDHTVGVFITDMEDRLLVVHPTETGDVWGIPKGVPDESELMRMTAIREVWEETGMDLLPVSGKMMYVGCQEYIHKNKTLIAYTIKLSNPNKIFYCDSVFKSRINDTMIPEVDDWKWVNFNTFKHKIQSEQVKLWESYKNLTF